MPVQPKRFEAQAQARRDGTPGAGETYDPNTDLIEYELDPGERLQFSFDFDKGLPVYPCTFEGRDMSHSGHVLITLDKEHRGVLPSLMSVRPDQIKRPS